MSALAFFDAGYKTSVGEGSTAGSSSASVAPLAVVGVKDTSMSFSFSTLEVAKPTAAKRQLLAFPCSLS